MTGRALLVAIAWLTPLAFDEERNRVHRFYEARIRDRQLVLEATFARGAPDPLRGRPAAAPGRTAAL